MILLKEQIRGEVLASVRGQVFVISNIKTWWLVQYHMLNRVQAMNNVQIRDSVWDVMDNYDIT